METRKCPSYEGYSVTSDGRVFTHRRRFGLGQGRGGGVKIDWEFSRELNSFSGSGGYPYFSVRVGDSQRSIPLHMLLLDAFVGPRPINMECRHLDGDPQNNKLENLCYGTVKQNAEDRARHGRDRCGENHPRAKLTAAQVATIRGKHTQVQESIAQLARDYGVGESTIRDIVKGRKWKHLF